jgi:hypothetical protein
MLGTITNTLRHPGTVTRCAPPAPSGVVNQFISASSVEAMPRPSGRDRSLSCQKLFAHFNAHPAKAIGRVAAAIHTHMSMDCHLTVIFGQTSALHWC